MKDTPRIVDNNALDDAGEEKGAGRAISLPDPLGEGAAGTQDDDGGQPARNHPSRPAPPMAFVLEPFDRVLYQSVENGYAGDGKAFRIDVKEDLHNVNQDVLLREINSNDDAYHPELELDDPVGSSGNIASRRRRPGTPC